MVAKSYKLFCCAVCLTIERDRELDHQRNFAACWVNCWLFQERSSQYISGGWIWWLSLTPRRLIWTNSSSLNYCVYLWLEFPFNNIGDHLVRQLRRVEGVLVLLKVRQNGNDFFKPMFPPNTDQTNSILLLRDFFLKEIEDTKKTFQN